MWTFSILLALLYIRNLSTSQEHEDPILYYYGLEESERSLPACGRRQACSALLLRYWRPPALVRLCRCARRLRCDTAVSLNRLIELNNRAYFQFCQSVDDWPQCNFEDTPLTVKTSYERMNPDELEDAHHKNIQLAPPTITFSCRCHNPNYWKLKFAMENETVHFYHCGSLSPCSSGEFCGNVSYDLNALYQSCSCPKHHICVHNGGITNIYITELLYRGKGWKAYCQRVGHEDSYEDY